MENKAYMKEYRIAVSSFSYYMALISLIVERMEHNILIDAAILEEALEGADYYQHKFLSARKLLGLPGDASALEAFCGDFSFIGFSIKQGRFSGDPDMVEPVLDKNCNFKGAVPTREEALKYEVGVYAYMCAKGAKNLFIESCGGGKKKIKRSGLLDKFRRVFGFLFLPHNQ